MLSIPFIDLPPLHAAAGTVRLPGSKSISNRVLLLAGLAAGTTCIHDALDSDDTRVMIDALRTLGCGVAERGATIEITGVAGRLGVREADLFLGNAGTAMRPLAAALALLGGDFTLRGVARMHERPIGDLVDALRQLGCSVGYAGQDGYPPLRIGSAGGPLRLDAPIRVRGDVSSQFLTALLLALPLVATRDVLIEVEGELISKPYVEITINLLARFGVDVRRDGWQRFTIPAGSTLRTPGDLRVEGDASSASYFIALGALAAREAPLRIEGVGLDSIQGDIRFVDAARTMGAEVRGGDGWLEVRRGRFPLDAITIDANHVPDAAMTLVVMALFARGTSRIGNIASWRVKETDRIAAMAAECTKLGAEVEQGDDFIAVTPPSTWRPAAIHTYDDHRIAMCFSLAALNGKVPVRILDPRCVGKTFPDYFETLFGVVTGSDVPVLTIDGPTASGKGTLASAVAAALGYHYLDSGALYRATALLALRGNVSPDDEPGLEGIARTLDVRFDGRGAWLGDENIADALRGEDVGAMASRVSAWARVRLALRDAQLAFARVPGLVADGRDMGTVLFPGAALKVFLTASAGTRAERRHKQLISKGISSNIAALRADLESRDARDTQRSVSPLKPAEDALLLDNSAQSVDESVAWVLQAWQRRRVFAT